ncbi:MAG: type IV pilus secretin PilQ [Acidobacteriota bacterium]
MRIPKPSFRSKRPHWMSALIALACCAVLLGQPGLRALGGGQPAAAAIASVPALQSPGQFSGTPITMKVVDISLADFFRVISEVSGLNVLIDPDVSGRVTMNMEAVPWDQLFEAVLRSNRLEKTIDGNLVRVSTKETIRVEDEAKRAIKRANFLASDTRTDTFHLNYAVANQISQTLEEQLSERGQIDVDPRTNTLIITDVVDTFERMEELIRRLDVPEQQVEIEARIVEATTNFSRELGAEFDLGIGNFFGRQSRPRGSDRNAGIAAVRAGAEDPVGVFGISLGNILDTVRLDAFISAAETNGDARILSKPRITAQNNAEATITQGAKIPIPVTQNFTTRVRFEEAALKLTVIPQITQENTVLLNLHVENNVPDFSQTVLGIPTILTSEAKTLVLVPDGGTTVIGGIFTEVDRTEIRKVPGLGNLPILGHLFKNTSKERETREILFFITVRIK